MTENLALIATFGAMIAWALGDFFIQKNVRKIGDIEALAFIGIFGALGLLPFILADLETILSFSNLSILLVLGVVTFFAAIFNFEALKQGKLSVIDVILELELPVAVILGVLFFEERITALQFFSMVVIFLGIVLISIRKSDIRRKHRTFEKGVILAIIAGVGMGFVDFLTAASAKQISPIMAIWVPWIVYGFICLMVIIQKKQTREFGKNVWNYKWILIAMAVFDTVAWYLYAVATHVNSISITTAITESYPALAMLLGVWFNKEKIEKHQYAGAGLAIVASVMLALFI